MAIVSGTLLKYDIQGGRESLSDAIYMITPEKTPFISGAGRGKRATATLEEWQTDELASVDTTNAHLEGDEATFSTPSATVRVGNYTQISRKTLIVSRTTEQVSKAGRKSEIAREMMKRSKELKRDQEAISLMAQAGNAGGSSTARNLASLSAWVKTNVDFNTSDGGNPTYTSGVPSAARTDGTLRAFTETIAKSVMQSGYTEGAEFGVLMVGPYNKTVVSGFSGIATRNYDLSNVSPRATAVIASVDVYVGDFHTVRVIPNRFQRERDGWFIDWEFVELRYLQPHMVEKLAKTGDAHKRMLITEWTLAVLQEAGLGLAADLTTAA